MPQIALTTDDLPVWPHEAWPADTEPREIASSVIDTLQTYDISGVYAYANSWLLDVDPSGAEILDLWVDAGHHIGNHTHSHIMLNDVTAAHYIHDIAVADELLSPWMSQAPSKTFRYTLNLWGDTEEKRSKVKTYLDDAGYTAADVTTWVFEWEWDRVWRHFRREGKIEDARRLEREYVDFCVAQLKHDQECCRTLFGEAPVGILLGHYVPFFAETLDRLLSALIESGVEFVPLETALAEPAYDRVGGVVSSKFQVYQQKLAEADGAPFPRIAPGFEDTIDRLMKHAKPLQPAKRSQVVINKRPPR